MTQVKVRCLRFGAILSPPTDSSALRIFAVSFAFSFRKDLKSHPTRIPCRKSPFRPRKAPKQIDMAGVMARFPNTILLTALGGTPIARAIAFREVPMGWRDSPGRISPGVKFILLY